MSDDAILKAACIQAAAATWQQTTLRNDGATDPKAVADNIARFAAMLYGAWTRHQP